MAFSFFQIPARGCPAGQQELNSFLQNNRVLSVDRRWVELGENSYWAICIDYLEAKTSSGKTAASFRERIDYRKVLNEADFLVFSELRDLRKQIANDEGVPVYAVFTNEHLAKMVENRTATLATLSKITGIGTAKVDKYGNAFLNLLQRKFQQEGQLDETSQSSDPKNI